MLYTSFFLFAGSDPVKDWLSKNGFKNTNYKSSNYSEDAITFEVSFDDVIEMSGMKFPKNTIFTLQKTDDFGQIPYCLISANAKKSHIVVSENIYCSNLTIAGNWPHLCTLSKTSRIKNTNIPKNFSVYFVGDQKKSNEKVFIEVSEDWSLFGKSISKGTVIELKDSSFEYLKDHRVLGKHAPCFFPKHESM